MSDVTGDNAIEKPADLSKRDGILKLKGCLKMLKVMVRMIFQNDFLE